MVVLDNLAKQEGRRLRQPHPREPGIITRFAEHGLCLDSGQWSYRATLKLGCRPRGRARCPHFEGLLPVAWLRRGPWIPAARTVRRAQIFASICASICAVRGSSSSFSCPSCFTGLSLSSLSGSGLLLTQADACAGPGQFWDEAWKA